MFSAVPYASADLWSESRSHHLKADQGASRCPPDSTCASPTDHSCVCMVQSSLVAGLSSSLLNIRRLTGSGQCVTGLGKEIDRERCTTKVGTYAQGRSHRCRTGTCGGQVQAAQTTNSVVPWTSSYPDRNGKVYPQPQKIEEHMCLICIQTWRTHKNRNEGSIVRGKSVTSCARRRWKWVVCSIIGRREISCPWRCTRIFKGVYLSVCSHSSAQFGVPSRAPPGLPSSSVVATGRLGSAEERNGGCPSPQLSK